jgi:hypothetical protein
MARALREKLDDGAKRRPSESGKGAAIDPGSVEVFDLDSVDGKTYRVGQCRR